MDQGAGHVVSGESIAVEGAGDEGVTVSWRERAQWTGELSSRNYCRRTNKVAGMIALRLG